jgi:hypothetical protein
MDKDLVTETPFELFDKADSDVLMGIYGMKR